MTDKRNFAFAIGVFLAPIAVAWFDLSVPAAARVEQLYDSRVSVRTAP